MAAPEDGARGRPRVVVLLAGLALAPLAILTWIAATQIDAAVDDRNDAETFATATRRAVVLVDLEATLDQEHTWAQAVDVAYTLGVPDEVGVQLLGFDLSDARDEAADAADALVESVDDPELREQLRGDLAQARSSDATGATMARRYAALGELLADRSAALLESLTLDVGELEVDRRFLATAQALQSAARLRESFAGQVAAFFALQFPGLGLAEKPLLELNADRTFYEQERARLADLTALEPTTLGDIAELDGDVEAFLAVTSGVVEEALEGSPPAPADSVASGGTVDFSSIDFEQLVATFRAAGLGNDAHLDLVSAVGAQMVELAEGAARSADRAWLTSSIVLGSTLLVTAAIAIWVSRMIASPLRRLSDAADALRKGDLSHDVPASGPREVHSVATALAEAVENLRVGESQADALARGRVDDPHFEEKLPGQLGSSLRAAVERLRVSLAERSDYQRRLAHQAAHDGLTGLPNRNTTHGLLDQAVARTRRRGGHVAVLFIDVDGFKQINDVHGHIAGDVFLCTVAERLVDGSREGDVVGRFGGDEFIVVAEPVENAAEALALADRLRKAVAEPVHTRAGVVTSTVSIGVAVSDDGALSGSGLIRDADLAVYLAKDRGRNRIELCDVDLRRHRVEASEIERSVRRALRVDEFELHYQPIVDGRTYSPVSVEGLIRWNHPERGLVGADDFIPVSERTELIVDVDRWSIGAAVAELARWGDTVDRRDLGVAVNISGRHLRTGTLVSTVSDELSTRGVDPTRLTLEITESALIDDLPRVARQLNDLRQLGVRIAIDDFGTGYTSISQLRELPIDVLKIDRSYTTRLADSETQSIVRLIVEIGHLVGATVTAEGIEDIDQGRQLVEMGCDHLQGFLFGQPEPASRATAPFDGVVALADRERADGRPVRSGQPIS